MEYEVVKAKEKKTAETVINKNNQTSQMPVQVSGLRENLLGKMSSIERVLLFDIVFYLYSIKEEYDCEL